MLVSTTENNTTSVKHILRNWRQETTCLLSQLLSKVTVTSCSFHIKCSTLLLDDALLKAYSSLFAIAINDDVADTLSSAPAPFSKILDAPPYERVHLTSPFASPDVTQTDAPFRATAVSAAVQLYLPPPSVSAFPHVNTSITEYPPKRASFWPLCRGHSTPRTRWHRGRNSAANSV